VENEETNQDNIGADSEIREERERPEKPNPAEALSAGRRAYRGRREAKSPKAVGITTEELAAKNRLKTTRDECGDSIIPGKRGHLYCDDGQVCAMWVNAKPILKTRLVQLGGKIWQGDISFDGRGHRVQDARVKGISLDKVPLALQLAGAKPRRNLSEAQLYALAKARAASPLISHQTRAETHYPRGSGNTKPPKRASAMKNRPKYPPLCPECSVMTRQGAVYPSCGRWKLAHWLDHTISCAICCPVHSAVKGGPANG